MLGSNILNIIFMFVAYRVYMTVMQRFTVKSIQIKLSAFMIGMTFFQVYIVGTYSVEIKNRVGGINLIIILIGCLIINIFLAYILSQVSDAYRYKYELSLAERLREIHLANYREISQKYEESRTIIHDIKKHLMVAENIKNADEDASKRYLSDICGKMDSLFCGYQCSNKILSIVLSQKISFAKSVGIEVNTAADDIQMEFIDDLDITAIFANLWDNATEACGRMNSEDRKFICMEMRRVNDFILINISNSYNGELTQKGKEYLSAKKDHDGVGLKSVRFSVEKYDGVFVTRHSTDVFKAEITIPIR